MTSEYELYIFDMDGVLIDSEAAGTTAAMKALAEYGVPARFEDFRCFTGQGDNRFVGGVSEKYGVPFVPAMKERMYDYYVESASAIRVFEWSLPLLRHLLSLGKKVAVASAADRRKVRCNLSRIGLPEEAYAAVVTGDMVTRNKPAPDIFRKAAELAGIPAEKCLVTEDALSGIRAARNAGMGTLALTTSFTAAELRTESPDAIADDPLAFFRDGRTGYSL